MHELQGAGLDARRKAGEEDVLERFKAVRVNTTVSVGCSSWWSDASVAEAELQSFPCQQI